MVGMNLWGSGLWPKASGVEQLPLGEGGAVDLATKRLDIGQLYQGLRRVKNPSRTESGGTSEKSVP